MIITLISIKTGIKLILTLIPVKSSQTEHLFDISWESTSNMFCREKIVTFSATQNQLMKILAHENLRVQANNDKRSKVCYQTLTLFSVHEKVERKKACQFQLPPLGILSTGMSPTAWAMPMSVPLPLFCHISDT